MTLLRRVLTEKRAAIVPLALALVANIGVYALVVYPLQARASGAEERSTRAGLALQAAERDLAAARTLVAQKARGDQELVTFYQKVVPADLAAARGLTYARLPLLARKTNVRYEERQSEVDARQDKSHLGRLKTRMVLEGDYQSVRRFVYELESSPEFVIIDDISLTQADPAKPLTLTLELSTYFRLGPNGS
jgi:hypothetical protein